MIYKKKTNKNQFILVGLIILSIIFTTIYYREPNEGPFHTLKRLTLSSVSSIQAGAAVVCRPFVDGWYFIGDVIEARNENVDLKDKIAELNRKIETYELIDEENLRLKELLQVSGENKLKTKLANVIGYSSTDMEKIIIIDKGSNDGLIERMPVMTNEGLVGQIINITGKASQVQLINDVKSGVAVETMKDKARGIIEGTSRGNLKMIMVKKEANVKVGDGVFTSGLGGVYPKGLYVGKVKNVSNSNENLFKDINIETSVDFYYLRQVLVVMAPIVPDVTGFNK